MRRTTFTLWTCLIQTDRVHERRWVWCPLLVAHARRSLGSEKKDGEHWEQSDNTSILEKIGILGVPINHTLIASYRTVGQKSPPASGLNKGVKVQQTAR